MRVDKQQVGGLGSAAPANSASTIGTGASSASHHVDAQSGDVVHLSNASSLIHLAKAVDAVDRQSKIANIAQQVRLGRYVVSAPQTSQSLILHLAA